MSLVLHAWVADSTRIKDAVDAVDDQQAAASDVISVIDRQPAAVAQVRCSLAT